MIQPQKPERGALQRLLSQACDGALDESVRLQLEQLLADHPDLMDDYVQFIAAESLLEVAGGKTVLDLDDANVKALQSATLDSRPTAVAVGLASSQAGNDQSRAANAALLNDLPSPGPERGDSSRWANWRSRATSWLPYAVSASLLLALVGWWLVRPGANIVATDGALWKDGRTRDVGAAVGSDWLELDEGEVRLAFRSGAMTTIRGPARFRALAANRGELAYGNASAHVPELAHGFTFETQSASIVDLGTGYRLQAEQQGRVDVHVTDGQVQIVPLATQQAAGKVTLSAGQAASVDGEEGTIALVPMPSLKTSTGIKYYDEHCASLGYRSFVHDDQIAVFLESRRIRLPLDVRLNIAKTGKHDQVSGIEGHAKAGQLVSSYLIHSAPVRWRHVLEEQITFPGRIIGIVSDSDSLNATNSLLGATWTLQCTHPERGLESAPNRNYDEITISSSRRTLKLKMRTQSIDQLRVLIAEE